MFSMFSMFGVPRDFPARAKFEESKTNSRAR
jgi:hypothetical protein